MIASDTDRTAIRCLEMALHPNTGDAEAIAGIYAWRRIAHGRLLSDICESLFDPHDGVTKTLPEYQKDWKKKLDARQHQITTLMGENIELNAELAQVRRALKELDRERQVLQTKLEQTKVVTVTPPKPKKDPVPPGERAAPQPAKIYPVQYTDLLWAKFGDAVWAEDVNWSQLRKQCIFKLLQDGVPFKEINQTFFSIAQGRYKNYRYYEEYDISIKTRSGSEICNEVLRCWDTLGIRVAICLQYPERSKGPKASELYPDGLAFPGTMITLVPNGQPVDESLLRDPRSSL